MRKNIFINLAGLLLALGIALGGVLGVRVQLAREQARLLQEGGMVNLIVQSEPSQSKEISTAQLLQTGLTEEELTLVIQNLESGAEPYPHEPGQNQLSMADAMEQGRSWLEGFFMPHLGLANFCLDEYRAGCYLWTTQEADPLLSYWTVTFSAKSLEAELILNATSGQILDASVRCSLPTEHQDSESLRAFLDDYVDSFHLEEEYTFVSSGPENAGANGGTLYQSVGSQGIFAAMDISNLIVSSSYPSTGSQADFETSTEFLRIRLRLTSKIEG